MNKNDIEKIINNSNVSEQDKEIFMKIFNSLSHYQNKSIDEVKKDVLENRDNNLNNLNLKIKFIDKKDLSEYEEYGWSKIEGSDYVKFLNVSYENIDKYINKKYIGYLIDEDTNKKEIEYEIIKSNVISYEITKMESKMNSIYTNIYNPWARKAVQIKSNCATKLNEDLYEDISKENINIDFRFSENGLDEIIEDKCLICNIKITNLNKGDRYSKLPGAKREYKHEFDVDEYSDIFIDDTTASIYRNKNIISIITKKPTDIFKKVTIIKDDTKKQTISRPTRLRSKSHIYDAINSYLTDSERSYIKDITTEYNNEDLIKIYDEKDKYFKSKHDFFDFSNKQSIYIHLEKNDEDIFRVDLYNYLIENLVHEYPEYEWIGVY